MSQVWFLELSFGSQAWKQRCWKWLAKAEKPPSGQEVGSSGHLYTGPWKGVGTTASAPDPVCPQPLFIRRDNDKGLFPRGSGPNPNYAVPGVLRPRRQCSPTSKMGRLGAARGCLPLNAGGEGVAERPGSLICLRLAIAEALYPIGPLWAPFPPL